MEWLILFVFIWSRGGESNFPIRLLYFTMGMELKKPSRPFPLLINVNSYVRPLNFSRHTIISDRAGRQQIKRLAVSVVSDGSVFRHRYCGHPSMLGLLCWPGDPVNVFSECQTSISFARKTRAICMRQSSLRYMANIRSSNIIARWIS